MPIIELTPPDKKPVDGIIELTPPTTQPATGEINVKAIPSPVEPITEPTGAEGEPIETTQEPFFLDEVSASLNALNREIANTATFGLSDLAAGAGGALAETIGRVFSGAEPKDLGEVFREPIERRKKFEKDAPGTAFVASVAGGFLNPISRAAGPLIAGGKNIITKALRGLAGGAGLSGTQIAGEVTTKSVGEIISGEDVNIPKKFGRVVTGATFGGIFGAGLPLATGGTRFVFNGIANLLTRFSSKTQGTKALRKVAEALERDGYTPSQALKRIDELGPEAALLDAGPNTRALGFTVKGIPGKGKTKIEKFIMERQEGIRDPGTGIIKGGQVQRIQEHIDDLIPGDFFTQKQQLANTNNAAKLYDSAFAANQNIESSVIDRILKTPDGRRAFISARRTLQNNRTNLSKLDPELTELLKETGEKATGRGVGRGLKLKFLDLVKRELFDLEQAAKTKFGKPTARSISITELRRDLINELDNLDMTAPGVKGGDYSKARLLAGDKLANQEALELGEKFMSKGQFSSPEELGIALNEMSPEARHLFRVGAAQALRGRISEIVSRADATKKLLDIQALEKKIALAFGDDELFKNYTAFLTKEKELFRAVTDVLGNSKTAERQAAIAEEGIDPGIIVQGLRDLTSGTPGASIRGIAGIFGGIKERVMTPQKQSEALANALTKRDITGLSEALPTPSITREGLAKSFDELLIRGFAAGQSSLIPENLEF